MGLTASCIGQAILRNMLNGKIQSLASYKLHSYPQLSFCHPCQVNYHFHCTFIFSGCYSLLPNLPKKNYSIGCKVFKNNPPRLVTNKKKNVKPILQLFYWSIVLSRTACKVTVLSKTCIKSFAGRIFLMRLKPSTNTISSFEQ